MNQETFVPQQVTAKTVKRNCAKCGYIRDTADTKCADCGRSLQSVAKIRAIGVFLVLVGTGLLGFMSWLALWMYNAIADVPTPGYSPRFTGGKDDVGFIVFAVGLVMVIGLTSIVGGVWQVVFGKRNKLIVALAVVLGLTFLGTGMWVSMNR
jgi:MFS family permease